MCSGLSAEQLVQRRANLVRIGIDDMTGRAFLENNGTRGCITLLRPGMARGKGNHGCTDQQNNTVIHGKPHPPQGRPATHTLRWHSRADGGLLRLKA
jgi:hypothetical protein